MDEKKTNPRRDCPTSGCKGRIETVTSTCRPGEIDVTIRCSACGRVRHAVLDADGNELSAEALAVHRRAALAQLSRSVGAALPENASAAPTQVPLTKELTESQPRKPAISSPDPGAETQNQ